MTENPGTGNTGGPASRPMDPSLFNADIAPVGPAARNWTTISFFSLWVGMPVNIPSYMIAASLVDGGMSWQQAMWTVHVHSCCRHSSHWSISASGNRPCTQPGNASRTWHHSRSIRPGVIDTRISG